MQTAVSRHKFSIVIILDYTNYIFDNNISGPYSSTTPKYLGIFNNERGWCPYCNRKVPCVFENHSHNDLADSVNSIWACQDCGWWEQKTHFSDMKRLREYLRYATLRNYSISDKEVPLFTLSTYIKDNPKLLYKIHPNTMEKLVQSVFSDFFKCEIHHCGQTGDGGIDLLFVESDTPMAIQVKRRMSANYVEPVSSIREMLGATQLSETKGAVFVTTANHFSSKAKEAAEKATELKLVESFELYDFDRFVSLFDLVSINQEPWKQFTTMMY